MYIFPKNYKAKYLTYTQPHNIFLFPKFTGFWKKKPKTIHQ